MKTTGSILLILLALLTTRAGLQPAVAGENETVIDDTDYRFRLTRPGPGWTLLRPDEIRTLVPDAVAGARMASPPNIHGCLIVERAAKEDLDWYATLLVENMPLENKRVTVRETIRFNGVAARRIGVVGQLNRLDVRYQVVLLFRQGFYYQITTWSLAELTGEDGAAFQPFLDAVEFTDGPIRLRTTSRPMRDMIGLGWEIRDNVFRSVVSGLQVAPPEGWRLAIGDELAGMNEDAEVGLISSSDPEVYVVFTPERASGVPRAQMEAAYRAAFEAPTGAQSPPPLSVTIAGRPVALTLLPGTAEEPFDRRHGVFWDGDMACQALAWYGMSSRDAATRALVSVLANVTRLEAGERSALRSRLVDAGYQQTAAGPTHSLRGGRFVEYEAGVSWSAPKGIWKLSTGQAARALVDGCTLFIELPVQGLMGVLRHDRDLDMDTATYHQKSLELMWGAADAADALKTSTTRKRDGRESLRVARALRTVNDQAFRYVVATGMNGTTGTRLMMWGYPGNVADSGAWLEAAIDGLDLHGAPKTVSALRGNRWVDHRLGYALTAPRPAWRFREETPDSLRPAGSLVRWSSPTERVQALAICNVGLAEKTEELRTSVLQNAARRFRGEPVHKATRIHGLPAEHLVWPGRVRLWTVVRGRLIYMLIHEWKPGTEPTLSPGEVLARLELLN